MADRDDLLDAVLDLQHDLGKYLRQPLAFLPKDAPDAEVRQALRSALTETRKGPRGTRAAQALWAEALEASPGLRAVRGFAQADAAVARAVGWLARLDDAAPLVRADVDRDLAAVQAALAAMRAALEDG